MAGNPSPYGPIQAPAPTPQQAPGQPVDVQHYADPNHPSDPTLQSHYYDSGEDQFAGETSLGGRPTIYNPDGSVAQYGTADQMSQNFSQDAAAAQNRPAYEADYGTFDTQIGNSDADRQLQLGALGMLTSAANGTAPSAAEILYKQANQGAIDNADSLAASVKGGPGARVAAMRNAQTVGAQTAAQGNIQDAALRANEMAAARSALVQGTAAARSGDVAAANAALGQTGQEVQANDFQRGLNDSTGLGYSQLALKPLEDNQQAAENAANNANSNFQQQRAQAHDDAGGSTWNKATQVVGMVTGGGAGAASAAGAGGGGGGSPGTGNAGDTGDGPMMSQADANFTSGLPDTSDVRAKTAVIPMGGLAGIGRSGASSDADKAVAATRKAGGYANVDTTPTLTDDQIAHANLMSALGSYDQPTDPLPPAPGISPAPQGYARSREGQPGSMFSPPIAKRRSWTGGAKPQTQADLDDIATSDARAKEAASREAYVLGRMHQGEQAQTGKPVPWAYGGPVRPGEDPVDKDPARGDSSYGRPAPPSAPPAPAPPAPAAAPPSSAAQRIGRRVQEIMAAPPAPPPVVPRLIPNQVAPAPMAPGLATSSGTSKAPPSPVVTSDERAKDVLRREEPMANANRSMEASEYRYRPEYTPPEQEPGERNVGPMAQRLAKDPVARTAVVQDDRGLLGIDQKKATKLVMGSLASLQNQVDALARGTMRGSR